MPPVHRACLIAFAFAMSLSLAPALPAFAQQASVDFGLLVQDPTLPVEINAENLAINNADGSALFSGNVRVSQGPMLLAASSLKVEYAPDSRAIRRLHASGGVTLTSGDDAAESREAVYTIDTGTVVMTGDVLLAQGPSVLSSQKLTINLQSGTGVMEGGVSTTFLPGGKSGAN